MSRRQQILLLAIVVLSGCGSSSKSTPDAAVPDVQPEGRMFFDINFSACKLGFGDLGSCDAFETAEIFVVNMSALPPCIEHKATISDAKGKQILTGVEVKEGTEYDLFLLLYCEGEPDCPSCFGKETITVTDDGRSTIPVTLNPMSGTFCSPLKMVTGFLGCPQ